MRIDGSVAYLIPSTGEREAVEREGREGDKYSHPTVKRTPLPQARVPVFLWIPRDSSQNAEELPGISGATLRNSESAFLDGVSLDSKIAVERDGR